MHFLAQLFDYLRTLSWYEATILFLLENLLVMGLALGFGYILKSLFSEPLVSDLSSGTSRQEWVMAFSTLLINTGITYAGFWLWREGIITIRMRFSYRMMLDTAVLFLGMDFLMYVFHYLVHKTFLYALIHRLHHRYCEPQPIDLFVLHPAETVAFGTLWLGLLFLYPADGTAIVLYLLLNVLFGIVGHLGVEPLPSNWRHKPFLRYLGSSTFHFQHHQQEGYNFGFYTSLWDRIFGTLAPVAEPKRTST